MEQVEVTYQGQSNMLLVPGFKGSSGPPIATAQTAAGTSTSAAQSAAAAAAPVEAGTKTASGSVGLSQVPNKIG